MRILIIRKIVTYISGSRCDGDKIAYNSCTWNGKSCIEIFSYPYDDCSLKAGKRKCEDLRHLNLGPEFSVIKYTGRCRDIKFFLNDNEDRVFYKAICEVDSKLCDPGYSCQEQGYYAYCVAPPVEVDPNEIELASLKQLLGSKSLIFKTALAVLLIALILLIVIYFKPKKKKRK